MSMMVRYFSIITLVCFLGVQFSYAQEAIQVSVSEQSDESAAYTNDGEGEVAVEDTASEKLIFQVKKRHDLSGLQSLFFTFWQHQSIQNAKKDRQRNAVVRPPSQAELDALERGEIYESEQEYIREISLNGIAYNSEDDWTIWLNEQRITPKAVPKEIVALKVFKDYIELKWSDEKTNNVFPIRLRPHQRFNLDARIFLTGE